MLHYLEAIKEPVSLKNSGVLFEIEQPATLSNGLELKRQWEEEQELIFTKLSNLFVKVFNEEKRLKNGQKGLCDDVVGHLRNEEKAFVDETDANEVVVEGLITKLHNLHHRVDLLAKNNNVDISNMFSANTLEEEQNNLCKLLENLNHTIDEIVVSNNIKLDEIQNKMINICVHADPKQPPLSLFMFLSRLRESGRKVACISSNFSYTQPPAFVVAFINQKLSLDRNRNLYEIVVTVIWRENLVTDCILYHDIFNDAPSFGEMMALYTISSLMNVDITKTMPFITLVNDQLRLGENIKTVMASLNNKLYKEINFNSDGNVAFGSFVVSTLQRIDEKMGPKLKIAVEEFLAQVPIIV